MMDRMAPILAATIVVFLAAFGPIASAYVRKDVDSLTAAELQNFREALTALKHDDSASGFAAIAGYHGVPTGCVDSNGKHIACCLHGMANFPHWHRLYVNHFGWALVDKGATVGVPYWDWTKPQTELPAIVQEPLYITDAGKAEINPFYESEIAFKGVKTARAVRHDELFEHPAPGENTKLFNQVLDALEEDDFCSFEVQFEVVHNAAHYMVGGRHTYSMSSLDYTAYDPLFFLHHSNVDRIWAIWQELQKLRNKPYNTANCALELMSNKLEPFDRDTNPLESTRTKATGSAVFDYTSLGYGYDDLKLGDYTVEQLKQLLDQRKKRARVFAGFRLHGFGDSADVNIYVCVPGTTEHEGDDCSTYAGRVFILGGPTEMAWSFDRLYKHDITAAVDSLGLAYDGNYYVHATLNAVNGTALPGDILFPPQVVYRPAADYFDKAPPKGDIDTMVIRKNADHLNAEELFRLRKAMCSFQADKSVNGYQAIAEFHGLPARCPRPDALNRMACCVHGMPTFLHWHRLFMKQAEDSLLARGARIGIPYWDFTQRMTALPPIVQDAFFTHAYTGKEIKNPFYSGDVAFENGQTTRDIQAQLFEKTAFGVHTVLCQAVRYALEQECFCDFAVQFEAVHNDVHAWVGGSSRYGMATLHYTSFDPLFFLYHAGIDRVWAIWQALQIHRGKPYKAYCANNYVHQSMKPFAFDAPLNSNPVTYANRVPLHVYDYEKELGYDFDTLAYDGASIPELNNELKKAGEKDRVFAGFRLGGIKTSAVVKVFICAKGDCSTAAGEINILGGSKEMPWRFDRPFKHEITDALAGAGLSKDDGLSIRMEITDPSGSSIPSSALEAPSIIFEPGTAAGKLSPTIKLRRNVADLSATEVDSFRNALAKLQADKSVSGFQHLAAFHGIPNWCPTTDAAKKFACCLHGMPAFPHWHRLHVVQFENAMRNEGYIGAIPYWDWTLPIKALPEMASAETYIDPVTGESKDNPVYKAFIDEAGHFTTRAPSASLFEQPAFGKTKSLADSVLLAFEQEDFCSFEVQAEIIHNEIHVLVGGHEPYSMASLKYTAFDPLFFLHHTNFDRIWAIYQALQEYRGKPANRADCALQQMRQPMSPFNLDSTANRDSMTHEFSLPYQVFDYKKNFNYKYDTLEFNDMTIPELAREIHRRQSADRIFANFMLKGILKSVLVDFYICDGANVCGEKAGEFYILGDPYEMPWQYDRAYKHEITSQVKDRGLVVGDRFYIKSVITDLLDNNIPADVFPAPTVSFEPAAGSHGAEGGYVAPVTAAFRTRKDLSTLTSGEVESLRNAFLRLQNDNGEEGYEYIASFHGVPAQCPSADNPEYVCCLHGMPAFPQWHRLYEVQVETALLKKGSGVAVPYWDWTLPFDELPALISDPTFYNSRSQRSEPNPFFRGTISFENAVTTRDPQPELFDSGYYYENTLLALEQDNFCDFEVQFEVLHNAIHNRLGGRDEYSLSSLHYSAYDPVFFLHHSMVDRIFAIWQELQRFRKLPYNDANCALSAMRQPLMPFNFESNANLLTKKYNTAESAFDYQNHFKYKYDTLEFHGMSIPQLDNMLSARKHVDRVYAGFLLSGKKISANMKIYICIPRSSGSGDDCSNYAGTFSILGGELEMPWAFDRLYKYEITSALKDLGLNANSDFSLKPVLYSVHGAKLDAGIFPAPTIVFEPAESGSSIASKKTDNVVRKDLVNLTPREVSSLMDALKAMKADASPDGFQDLASFHALPPLCPDPKAADRWACCLHGMATFPMWHRMYMVQFEDSMTRHGCHIGIPYWDWTKPMTKLPSILTDTSYTDPFSHMTFPNPFNKAAIAFEGEETKRDIQGDKLFEQPGLGKHTWLFEQTMFALEQENWCDFEIQFEILHNALHAWLGGKEKYSFGHLHYASYDPAFYLHHSMADRLWAIWQEMQKYRGLPSDESNCALEMMKEPLKPFSFGEPWNLNKKTTKFSKPSDTFNYKDNFHYEYENLEIGGMSVPQLVHYLEARQEKDRVFAGFLLAGFGMSAQVDFDVCQLDGTCVAGGSFNVLGGSAEMPWAFDRNYKYEITAAFDQMGIRYNVPVEITYTLTYYDGTPLDAGILNPPSVFFSPGKESHAHDRMSPNHIRKNVEDLTEQDVESLMAALDKMKSDTSQDGFQAIASFHGLPTQCKNKDGTDLACCLHGMPIFLHWHRLYAVQFEDALRHHGSSVALPYWDWSKSVSKLPDIFTRPQYYDAWADKVVENPFQRGYIESANTYTIRDVQPELFQTTDGHNDILWPGVLMALEQTDYCDFEVQFEIVHNAPHHLVGGHQVYSLTSLHYSSYDPFFFIHHSNVDRIWAIWQALQKHRKLPYDAAFCALDQLSKPMEPFNRDASYNPNPTTRAHAKPMDTFDYENLGYTYDTLELDGMSIPELDDFLNRRQNVARVFAGFLLAGFQTSCDVQYSVCVSDDNCVAAGLFFVLGGEYEMPWAFDRLYKADITDAILKAGLHVEDVFNAEAPFTLKVEIVGVDGNSIPSSVLKAPTIIYQAASEAGHTVAAIKATGSGIRKNVDQLTPSEIENLREAMAAVQADNGPAGFQTLAAYHGEPAMCKAKNGDPQICCEHGMPTFPHWHRLYMKQMEDALVRKGAKIGLPYWDWTSPMKALPFLVSESNDNPWHDGEIAFKNVRTTRAPVPKLFSDPQYGEQSFFYRRILYALEQEDYCDFEVQFEMSHNAIHSWVGGHEHFSMSSLDYTSYDPLFYLHHSNTDRIWAIWQALQKYRGLPYDRAYCHIHELRKNLSPFSWDNNWNSITRTNSRANDVFDYTHLGYQYDTLKFNGMNIPELEVVLEGERQHDRTFAGFLLSGFQTSCDVDFEVCRDDGQCAFAGTFAVLGGEREMPWAFDRLFKYEISDVLKQLSIGKDDPFNFKLKIVGVDGTEISSSVLPRPTVLYEPGKVGRPAAHKVEPVSGLVRKEVHSLTLDEAKNLRDAMFKLQNDHGKTGFEYLASFHGAPGFCPENANGDTYSCCIHGMATFPHWHRLFVVQIEMALAAKGATVGIPYWDWTTQIKAVPNFIENHEHNPWYNYYITFVKSDTSRTPDPRLFDPPLVGGNNFLYHNVLLALEEDNYCDFEVQFEVFHNTLHAWIGGADEYSMATLEYTAFDPLFYIHHTQCDRLWVIWEELQKLRGKPYRTARCAGNMMEDPMPPFSFAGINDNELTRENSLPVSVMDYSKFGYSYDDLKVHDMDISDLNVYINKQKQMDRIFIGIALHGFGGSANIDFYVCTHDTSAECNTYGGTFSVLGGPTEMPWAFDRLFKYEVTEVFAQSGLSYTDEIHVRFDAKAPNGTSLPINFPPPVVVYRPAGASYEHLYIQIGGGFKGTPKITAKRGTHITFNHHGSVSSMVDLRSYSTFYNCDVPPFGYEVYPTSVSFNLKPGRYYFVSPSVADCRDGKRGIIHITEE